MWTSYSIALRLASPLHIGLRASGNLMQTRVYVPGRAFWGALAARLARDTLRGDYEKAGAWVHENLRYTYLFPSLKHGATFSPIAAESSEWQLVHGYMSTGLEDGRRKLDGSLHEVEYMAPATRSGAPVYLTGNIWVRARATDPGMDKEALRVLLSRLAIGGERSYGWGRFSTVLFVPAGTGALSPGWNWSVTDKGNLEVTPARIGVMTMAHIEASISVRPDDWLGPHTVEPWVGRLTPPKGRDVHFGSELSEMKPVISLGAEIRSLSARFQLGPFGLWTAVL